MPRNDDGEFELILGNRQLLSVFFLVVVLLTVFFTLGYVVGRSSGPVGQVEVAKGGRPADSGATNPIVIDPVQTKPSPSSGISVHPVTPAPPAVQEAPVRQAPAPEVHEPPKPVKPVEKKPEPVEAPAPTAPVASGENVPEPAAGMYMQVVSVMKPQADSLVDMLRKQRGLPAVLAPGPAESRLLRVLVGPYKDQAALSKAKTDLETIGFHPFPKKY